MREEYKLFNLPIYTNPYVIYVRNLEVGEVIGDTSETSPAPKQVTRNSDYSTFNYRYSVYIKLEYWTQVKFSFRFFKNLYPFFYVSLMTCIPLAFLHLDITTRK